MDLNCNEIQNIMEAKFNKTKLLNQKVYKVVK